VDFGLIGLDVGATLSPKFPMTGADCILPVEMERLKWLLDSDRGDSMVEKVSA